MAAISLPDGIDVVALTGRYTHPDGTGMRGSVTLTPRPDTITAADTGLTVQGPARATHDDDGEFTLTVVATDSDRGPAP